MTKLVEHELKRAALRQKSYYQRQKEKISIRNKNRRLAIKKIQEGKSNTASKEISDLVRKDKTKEKVTFNLATLYSYFEAEENSLSKPINAATIKKHKESIREVFRIVGLKNEDDFMSVILDADEVVNKIINAKQVKNPDSRYTTSTISGRIQTILKLFDFVFPEIVEIARVDKLKIAKARYDLKYREKLDTKANEKRSKQILHYSYIF